MRSARLDGPVDLDGFRRAARRLFAQGVPPEQVNWSICEGVDPGLLDQVSLPVSPDPDPVHAAPLSVPPAFVDLMESVILHRDPQRFGLLYQLLWRLQREASLRRDPLDAQWMHAQRMAHAVHHDMHKMKAFVRFRPIDRGPAEPPLHVAWFEPQHHVVEAVAPFFAARFATLRWTILTPLRSVFWDGERLALGAPARRDQAPPADAGEQLWLTYYEHIFNPARLKLAMMKKEMPVRYWKNLPEAALIAPLSAAAAARSAAMVEQAPTVPTRRIRPIAPSLPAVGPVPTLEEVRAAATRCSDCPLHADATQVVFGEGPPQPPLMFVGEQPGDHEDLRGRPFVGPAGQLFDRALSELGMSRGDHYVTNAVKHFKHELRGTRRIHKTPAQQEAAACLQWLEREIALVQPRAIVALGATAARSVLNRHVAVLRERGQWLQRDDGVPVLVTLHPSALLRMAPPARDAAYAEWLADLARAAASVDAPGTQVARHLPGPSAHDRKTP
jgi:probable DNA metabolism protein